MSGSDEHHKREAMTIAKYEASNGTDVGDGWLKGLPLVILTTTGRVSGKPRKVVLVFYKQNGVYAVVASGPDPIGGSTLYAQWYLNIVDDPHVTVRDGADEFEGIARTATAEEKAAWWPHLTAIWPDYDDYQAKTTKNIPIVLIERT